MLWRAARLAPVRRFVDTLPEPELENLELGEKRRHPRARVKLPLRIRWRGPHGLVTEFADTLDISRTGLLIHHAHDWPIETSFWITTPYDRTPGAIQPEISARISRTTWLPGGGKLVAFHWQVPSSDTTTAIAERRHWHRLPFSLPVSVRRIGDYFPEISMTLDLSLHGTRFEAVRRYLPGEMVQVHVQSGEWGDAGEKPGLVIRVEAIEGSYIEPVEGQLELSFMFRWRPSNHIAVVF